MMKEELQKEAKEFMASQPDETNESRTLYSVMADFYLFKQERKRRNLEESLSRMKDDSGREGCTYGDTDYDSLSTVYGYNMAIEHVITHLSDLLKET